MLSNEQNPTSISLPSAPNPGKIFFTDICPTDYRNAHLSGANSWQVPWVKKAALWARNPVSVIINGKFGRGKTWFAFAMLKEMFCHRPDLWPRYFTSRALDLKLLDAAHNDGGESHLIHSLQTADLLFIDDLGRGEKRQANSMHFTQRLIGQLIAILNYRHEHKLPTIITTNWQLDDFAQYIDESISSRMQQWLHFEFSGPDLRSL